MPSPNDRLAPPLMSVFRAAHEKRDAKTTLDLRDAAGERVIAARRSTYRQPITESGLRREVAGDLVELLNTINLDSVEDLSATPEVASSILNFGLPDLARRTIEENTLGEIADEIQTALTRFEPRLARQSIRARRDDAVSADELKLRFLVHAELRTQPIGTPVEFIADVDIDSGKIKIERL
jgi:type VI secretion system protein ImpF